MPSQLSCLMSSLNATACVATNTTCLCLDKTFESVVTACVVENCTVREMLSIKNGTASNCGQPEPTQDETLLIVTILVITLQTIFFVLRMLCRAVRIAPWGADDTSIVIAFVSHFVGRTPFYLQLLLLT